MENNNTASIAWGATFTACLQSEETIASASSKTGAAGIPNTPNAERYEQLEVLGRGGMGQVVAARDSQFGRVVALKEMLSSGDGDLLRRFLLESIVTANLEHPSIVPVYERGVRAGVPFYAMRKVSGKTLSKSIAEATSMEARLALVPAVIRVAHALGFAHAHGVVHRDVKPENIVLGAHGETVLLDWGIAKVRDLPDMAGENPLASAVQAGATVAGSVLGTPAYMAPEQARGDVAAIDARTDVFALGAVLYEVLTGKALYRAPTLAQALTSASSATFEPIQVLAPKVPSGLRAIVECALAKDPKERFADGAAMAKALEEVQSRAWLVEETAAERWFATAVTVFGLLLTILTAVGLMSTMPSIGAQGPGALFASLAGAAAMALAALEWKTRGRSGTLGLGVALACICALIGFANAAAGLTMTFGRIAEEPVVSNELRWRTFMSYGINESLGNVTRGCLIACVALLLLALVDRRNKRLDRQK